MRKIFLHGSLGDRYGHEFELEVSTAGEAFRALAANFSGFMKQVREGAWHIVRAHKGDIDGGISLDETQIKGFHLGRKGDLHILPYVAGSKRGGLLKVVLGVVLVGAAFALTGGALASPILGAGGLLGGVTGSHVALIGAAVALAGVSSMLTPEQKASDEDGSSSFTMSGPGNTSNQGGPVPLAYGEIITGGTLISGGVDIEQIAVTGDGGGSVGSGGKK
jgi:predicted phage tail protein